MVNELAHRDAEALLLNGYKLNDAYFAQQPLAQRLKFERALGARFLAGSRASGRSGKRPDSGAGVTLRMAVSLVTAPAALLTVTAKGAPLSARVLAGVLWLLPVTPAMAAPFFVHW